MLSLARSVLAPLGGWWGCYALLHLLERLGLVATAFLFVHRGGAQSAAALGALGIVLAARGFTRGTLRTRVEVALTVRGIDALFRGNLLRASPLEADESEAAIIEGVHYGARILAELSPQLIADTVAAFLVTVVLGAIEPRHVLLVGALSAAIGGGGVVVARRVTIRESERSAEAYRPVLDAVVAAIHGRLELVANGVDVAFRQSFAEAIHVWSAQALRAERLSSIAGRLPVAAGCALVAGALFFDSAWHGEMTAGALADAALFASVLPVFAGLASALHEMTKARVRFEPMAQLLSGDELPQPASPASRCPEPFDVVWRKVCFSYSGTLAPALQHVDLTWPSARVLVIAGPNGSGKSTVLRLLLGVTNVDDGEIRVGAVRLAMLDQREWRRTLAYLPQRPYLGERMTVHAAMDLVAHASTLDQRRAALERVALWDVLTAKSPTDPLSAKVGSLSTGERQRLALARLLASDKPLLLLDEPDANLDAAGIKLVADLVRELSATKRIAIVAHTEELISLGDIVVTLDHGRVVRTTESAATRAPRAGTAG